MTTLHFARIDDYQDGPILVLLIDEEPSKKLTRVLEAADFEFDDEYHEWWIPMADLGRRNMADARIVETLAARGIKATVERTTMKARYGVDGAEGEALTLASAGSFIQGLGVADARQPGEGDQRRREQFRRGWQRAKAGKSMGEAALGQLTWTNLGFRAGQRWAGTVDVDDAYDIFVRHQAGQLADDSDEAIVGQSMAGLSFDACWEHIRLCAEQDRRAGAVIPSLGGRGGNWVRSVDEQSIGVESVVKRSNTKGHRELKRSMFFAQWEFLLERREKDPNNQVLLAMFARYFDDVVNDEGYVYLDVQEAEPPPPDDDATEEDADEQGLEEGGVSFAKHRRRERSRKVVQKAKAARGLVCEACELDFAAVYGDLGEGYIEAHHVVPLAKRGKAVSDPVEDMRVLCANCHRMIHRLMSRRDEIVDVADLKAIMRRPKGGQKRRK